MKKIMFAVLSAILITATIVFAAGFNGDSIFFPTNTGTVTITPTAPSGPITLTLPGTTGTILSTGAVITVPQGGSGAATFTDGGILLGSGTGAFTALGAAANGQIPIGDGTTDPVLANITETGDALVVTNGAGTIALSAHAGIESLADLTETNGGIPYGTAADTFAWLAAGAEGTLLMGNGAGAPSFLAAGTAGQYLKANGAADPVWTSLKTVETVTTTNVITNAECGKTFYLNNAAGFVSTLPVIAVGDAGCEFKFVVKTVPTSATLNIITSSTEDVLAGSIFEQTASAGDASDGTDDTINIVNSTATVGDTCNFNTDGVKWFYTCFTGADGGIAVSKAD